MQIKETKRLISLDAARGFCLVGMVIVNAPGHHDHIFPPLRHAEWHGITFVDVGFPFFLFIVGVSVALAYTKRLAAQTPKPALLKKIIYRSMLIFVLGILLGLWPRFHVADIRITGVLQRIALVFFACALLFLYTNWKQQLWIAGGILVSYWAVMGWVPVPIDSVIQNALDTGTVERSHLRIVRLDELHRVSENCIAANYQPGTNLAAWFDRHFLPGRMNEYTFDALGLLSTLPAMVTGMIGLLIGQLVLSISDAYRKLAWLFFIGFLLFILGEVWDWSFPLNKNLWSSSFVLWTGGMATMALAAAMLLVDVLGYKSWTKIGIVYGANPITTFVLAAVGITFLFRPRFGMPAWNLWFFEKATAVGILPELASFMYSFLYMLIIYIPIYFLYRKKLFIRI